MRHVHSYSGIKSGGTLNFFGECVPHGFPKVGSRELILLEKWGVLGTKILKICILRVEILAKTRLKMQIFLTIENGEPWIGRLRSTDWPEKNGVMTTAHSHTTFQCERPLGDKVEFTYSLLWWFESVVASGQTVSVGWYPWPVMWFDGRKRTAVLLFSHL